MAHVTICTASDSNYFGMLSGLLDSLRDGEHCKDWPVSILDVGLKPEEVETLKARGATVIEAGWDVEFPGRETMPGYYRAMSARPYLPKYFPGHDIYLWIDADAWVQDSSYLNHYVRGAERGKIACVPEMDRGYWTMFRRPKMWAQNQKAFAWGFGLRAGDKLGRNPVVGAGMFAIRGDAPHWKLWADAHRKILNRWRLKKPGINNFYTFLSEQTALNYMIFADKAPSTFLPAYTHWVCGKGDLLFDKERKWLVEPHEPHQIIGVVHPGGAAMKARVWEIETLDGDTVNTQLTYHEFMEFRNGLA
jgi:hypothetical protein